MKDWKEFDKKFPYNGIIIEDDGSSYSFNDIKQFIQSELDRQKEEIIKMVESKKKVCMQCSGKEVTNNCTHQNIYTKQEAIEYNEALYDIIKELKEL